ncbi:MAG: Crp/Fnr family transcriptional regulator [Thermoleophilia bacterium]|nr:Crp/Fnr family transcriptional regulator [Thermoleophilia bacterium]
MAKAIDTLDAVPVVDRVRAAIAACEHGIRPSTIEYALELQGELRAITEQLEDDDELVFERGRLHPAAQAEGDATRAAYAGLHDSVRSELHARLARAIGHTSYEPGIAELEQAWHELRAGDPDAAQPRLRRLAEDGARAADHLLVVRAVDLLIDSGAEVDPRLHELHARAALEVGDPRAHELWAIALEAWELAGDADHATRAVVSWFWSNPDDPEAAARLAQESSAPGSPQERGATGWATYAGAVRAIFDARWQDSIDPLERALAKARDTGDRELEAAVLGSLATARSYLGQLDLAIDLLRRSAPLAAANADAVTIRRIRHNLVETLVEALRTGEAIEEAQQFAADLQRLGARSYLPGALALEARVRALAGDIEHARALASRALAGDRELEEPQRDVYVHMVAAELLAMGGDTDRFRGFVGDVRDRSSQFGFDSYDEALDEVTARAAVVSGDPKRMAAVLEHARTSEPTGLAVLAVAGARLRLELHDQSALATAHDAIVDRMRELDEVAAAIPVVALSMRECDAVLARDVDAIEAVAAAWDDARRPGDAAILRRALLAVSSGDVAGARVNAQLEALGWSALAARPVGSADVATRAASGSSDDGAAAGTSIAAIALVASLPASERAAVLGAVQTVELQPPGEAHDASTAPPGVCIVASGEVRLLRAEPGSTERRLVVAALGPGDVFGHESLVESSDSGALVEAAVPSLLHVVPADRVASLTAEAPSFAAALLADASERLGEARLLAGESALLPVETRLARTLVRLSERFGRPSLRGELLLDTSLTHADIASMIGSQRARVSSLLNALHKAGVTDTWKRRIIVLDTAELRARAGLG